MTFTNIDPFLASCCWGIREGLPNELLLLRLLARAPRHPHLCRLGMQGMSTTVFLNILQSNEQTQKWMISKRNFKRKASSFRAPHSKHQGLSLINGKEWKRIIHFDSDSAANIYPWVPTRGFEGENLVVVFCHQSHLTETLHEFRAPVGNSCQRIQHLPWFHQPKTSPSTLHISSDLHDVRNISLPPNKKTHGPSHTRSDQKVLAWQHYLLMPVAKWCNPRWHQPRTFSHDNSNDLN